METEEITQEAFDKKLLEILSEYTANQIIDIPGIYECLAEEFNNDVIDAIRKENQ